MPWADKIIDLAHSALGLASRGTYLYIYRVSMAAITLTTNNVSGFPWQQSP